EPNELKFSTSDCYRILASKRFEGFKIYRYGSLYSLSPSVTPILCTVAYVIIHGNCMSCLSAIHAISIIKAMFYR
nr:hypothetical protein [Tanacetum cinerariifolium]